MQAPKTLLYSLAFLLLVTSSGCGGGGGGGGEGSTFQTGTYVGATTFSEVSRHHAYTCAELAQGLGFDQAFIAILDETTADGQAVRTIYRQLRTSHGNFAQALAQVAPSAAQATFSESLTSPFTITGTAGEVACNVGEHQTTLTAESGDIEVQSSYSLSCIEEGESFECLVRETGVLTPE